MKGKAISAVPLVVLLTVSIIMLASGCGGSKAEPAVASKGDTVKVNYTGKLSDGTVFDSSQGKSPLQFVLGAGNVIQGFDEGVTGMKTGESKTIKIPPEKAYGMHRPDLVFKVPIDKIPGGIKPRVGQQLQIGSGSQAVPVKVVEVTTTDVTLDGNHHLAGKELTFEVNLVEVRKGE